MSSLRVEGLAKWFGRQQVLYDISFACEPGKVNMIIGPSGCGKTVLLKCIVGLIQPDRGKVFFGDLEFLSAKSQDRQAILRNLGMLFQSSALFDSMTVGENVAFPLRVFTRQSEKQIQDRVAYCLERVGLAGTQDKYPAQLSGGMKRRVGLARAIALNPQYLFCDEPNSGLDPLTARRIDALIRELTQEFGTTTLVVTHDLKSVVDMGEKILFLYEGRAEWQGTREELLGAVETMPPNLQAFLRASGLVEPSKAGKP